MVSFDSSFFSVLYRNQRTAGISCKLVWSCLYRLSFLPFNNFIINTVDTSSTGSVSSQIFFLPVILILDIVFFQSLLHLHLLPSLCLLPSSASNPPLNSSDKLVVYEISHLLSHHGSPPTLCNASDYPVLPVFCLFLCSIISQLLRRFVCMVPAMASMH